MPVIMPGRGNSWAIIRDLWKKDYARPSSTSCTLLHRNECRNDPKTVDKYNTDNQMTSLLGVAQGRIPELSPVWQDYPNNRGQTLMVICE